MNRILSLFTLLLLVACETAPKIVADTTEASPVVLKLRHQILNGDKVGSNWGWMLWYLPVLLLALAWGWKEFFVKKDGECEEEKKSEETVKEEKPADAPTPPTP